MKTFILLLLSLILSACAHNNNQGDFINYDCNIPIIECVLGNDTVNLIVDSGAEYSLINGDYYKSNTQFNLIRRVETKFSGIGGTNIQFSDIVQINTSLGYITFVEQDLTQILNQLSQYNIVGVLGSDFLEANDYIIDYKVRKIYQYEQLDSIYGKSNR